MTLDRLATKDTVLRSTTLNQPPLTSHGPLLHERLTNTQTDVTVLVRPAPRSFYSRYRGRQSIRHHPGYATYHNDRERVRAFNVEQEARYKTSGMDEHQTDPMPSGQRRDCFVQKFLHAVGCTSLVCS